MKGCFWTRRGLPWRQRLESMLEKIIALHDERERSAASDQQPGMPRCRSQAFDMWTLARV